LGHHEKLILFTRSTFLEKDFSKLNFAVMGSYIVDVDLAKLFIGRVKKSV